jgi:hypothetical protein
MRQAFMCIQIEQQAPASAVATRAERPWRRSAAAQAAVAGKGRASTMDLGEWLRLLGHLRLLPTERGGAGWVSKTAAAAAFRRANRGSGSGGDGDDRELDAGEFRRAADLLARAIGRRDRAELLGLPPAPGPPSEENAPPAGSVAAAAAAGVAAVARSGGAAAAVRAKAAQNAEKARERAAAAAAAAAAAPASLQALFAQFAAGDGAQVRALVLHGEGRRDSESERVSGPGKCSQLAVWIDFNLDASRRRAQGRAESVRTVLGVTQLEHGRAGPETRVSGRV